GRVFACSACCSTLPPPSSVPLSLHDALPISGAVSVTRHLPARSTLTEEPKYGLRAFRVVLAQQVPNLVSDGCAKSYRNGISYLADRKSTRLNSSHVSISYAVFCLKKKMTHLM